MVILQSFHEWLKNSLFIYPLLLSLISAYIFYLFFEVLPKKKQQKNIRDQVVYHTENILHYLLFLIQDAVNSNIDQSRIRSHCLTEEEIRKAMTNVFFDDKLKQLRVNKDGNPSNVGEGVVNQVNSLKNESEILFRYLYHLDTNLVNYVNEALRNGINQSWVNAYQGPSLKLGDIVFAPVRKDVSHYASYIFNINQTYRKIEDYLFEKFPKHKSVLRRKIFHYLYDKQDWKRGIRLAQKLYKFKEHTTESAIWIVKCYIKLNNLSKAIKLSNLYLSRKDFDLGKLEESFKYDRYFQPTDFELLYPKDKRAKQVQTSNSKNNRMKSKEIKKLYIVAPLHRLGEAKEFMNEFLSNTTHFQPTEIECAVKDSYPLYDHDLNTMDTTEDRAAMSGIGKKYVRLLLPDKFFIENPTYPLKLQVISHELGHYFTLSTAPVLINLCSFFDRCAINLTNPDSNYFVDHCNSGYYFIAKIVRLVEEIHAEKWASEHFPDESDERLKGYYKPAEFTLSEGTKPSINGLLFYASRSLWGEVIFKTTSVKLPKENLEQIKADEKRLLEILGDSPFKHLSIFTKRDKIVETIISENFEDLKVLYFDLMSEYNRFIGSCLVPQIDISAIIFTLSIKEKVIPFRKHLKMHLTRNKLSIATPESSLEFPDKCANSASMILGQYLKDELGLDSNKLKLVSGTNVDGINHSWLEFENVIFDITADQHDQDEVIIEIANDSPFHGTFSNLIKVRHFLAEDDPLYAMKKEIIQSVIISPN